LVEVPIEKIASNSYSLNYAEYMKDEAEEEPQYEDGVVVKTLGEVCNFKNGKGIKKDRLIEGEYPVIGGGQKPMGFHNKYNSDENTILCSSSGAYAGFISKYDKKVWASDCFSIIPKNNSINNTYLYYLLKTIQDKIYKLQTGTAQPHIYSKDLQNIKIPIPTLERQQEIVKYLDFIYEKANKTSREKIAELKQFNEFCLTNQKIFGDNVVKGLGEVCKVNQGTYIKPDMKIPGEYPVYGGGNVSYYINQFNREDDIIVAKDGVSADCVRYEKQKFFLNHHGWTLICKEQVIKKYMFYYLQSIQPELLSIAKGTAQLGINQDNFYKIKIPIPSLERQQEIVAYCEFNDALIRQLEMEIENNKKQAQMFIDGIVKSQGQILSEELPITSPEDHDEVNSVVSSASSSSAVSLTETKPKTRKFIVKKSLP
jgi:type I restriction enzyme S subunit